MAALRETNVYYCIVKCKVYPGEHFINWHINIGKIHTTIHEKKTFLSGMYQNITLMLLYFIL